MAAGIIIQDHGGHCLFAASVPLTGFTSPELAEALALRQAVTLAREKGFNNVGFTSDCFQRVKSRS
jgi:hypothetical protein